MLAVSSILFKALEKSKKEDVSGEKDVSKEWGMEIAMVITNGSIKITGEEKNEELRLKDKEHILKKLTKLFQ